MQVCIGKDPRTFVVHKHYLKSSSFFESKLSDRWNTSSNSQVEPVSLPDHEPEDFETFVNWLYTKRISPNLTSEERTSLQTYNVECRDDVDRETLVAKCYDQLGNLYALGQFLDDPDFRDGVVDAVRDVFAQIRMLPSQAWVEKFWPGLPERCAVKCMLLRYFAWRIQPGDNLGGYLRDFQADLAPYVVEAMDEFRLEDKPDLPWDLNRCEYHEHNPVSAGSCTLPCPRYMHDEGNFCKLNGYVRCT